MDHLLSPEKMSVQKVNLREKLSLIDEHWRPKVVGELNGQEVKLVKLKGEFVWHHHDTEDELFLCLNGVLTIEFHDKRIELHPGEFAIVPHGVEHRTSAVAETEVLIFEPSATINTGNISDPVFTAPTGVKI
jgi:mannose-6-phosphate isomerase-like protein (cupin superfamily)